uniref:zinc finger BED domain-containing protein RICESLEEPER 2-like n=1 Tax=Erigeron canadensis TaxID=72917 RepID=UPI001CB8C7B0|nr:zinc finger BED domain-containing protein RICESLEEPER 2-like [Erigeron canadensis]
MGSGTSTLWTHARKCEFNPHNKEGNTQTRLMINKTKDDETGQTKVDLQAVRFIPEKGKRAVAEMIIIDELPLSFVENEGFRRLMKVCQPALHIVSRTTIKKDCYELYLEQKAILKEQLKKSPLRVCLTTDTWTSLQRIDYMCLTSHYVDENWKLQKKVINFCQISSHRGHDIGKAIETCLKNWEIENVLTITVDNASSNDTAVDYLKSRLVKWNDRCILQGKWTHVRCVAHIMNLIVQDGLKELGISIDRVRAAVRWVRLSTARLKKFYEYARQEKITCEKSLCLDVPTRWNSTYLMLSVAAEYEKAFDMFAEEDYMYFRDLQGGERPGVPETSDWQNVKRLIVFLRHFYELTLRVSGTKYITSNTYLDSIYVINDVLEQCSKNEDKDLQDMAREMKLKFDKYWGDVKKFNLLVFIASVFDPRTKFLYLETSLHGMYGVDIGTKVAKCCEEALKELFNDYKRIHSA